MAMSDNSTTVQQLKDLVLDFSKERNWEQFHHPKDLGIALVCEVGELFEHFRYRTNAEIENSLSDPATQTAIANELADCLWLVLRLGEVMGIDLASSLESKVAAAALKYPVELSYGRSDKYTAYQGRSTDEPS